MELTLIILLVIFQLKHFIADYPLQTPYMLGKANITGWVRPLVAHAFVHSMFTLSITLFFVNLKIALLLAIMDLTIHFIVDRIKASPSLGGRFNPTQPYFWWALGADQMVHHLTHYVFIYVILSHL